MKNLASDIKNGTLKKVYLLYGDEAYLKKMYKNKIRDALVNSGDTMNFSAFEGSGINVREVIDIAETMPFFAEHRVIIIEESKFFKNTNEELAGYLKNMPDSTCIIFVETEVDRRSKMFKAVKEAGYAAEFGIQESDVLTKWVLGILKNENKKITRPVMELFLSKAGSEMENIENELNKLISYVSDRDVIEKEDVEAICSEQITNQIFEMINAIVDNKPKEALTMYYDLLALKEPPMRILFLISRQYNILMKVKSLLLKGCSKSEIAKEISLSPYIAEKYIKRAGSFKIDELKKIVEECVTSEENVKTGALNEKLSVELLIVNLCNRVG